MAIKGQQFNIYSGKLKIVEENWNIGKSTIIWKYRLRSLDRKNHEQDEFGSIRSTGETKEYLDSS